MENQMEKIVSLAKRRGFIFPGSEIYGGLAGTWDLGPLGAELAHNIKELWWNHFVRNHEEMYGLASSILMPERVWEASGHLEGFADPLVECKKCKKRFRQDELSGNSVSTWKPSSQVKCPECGGELGEPKQFNLMFKFGDAYLRPEIAQGMFVNFKNVLDTMRPALPFGIAQIGKAFRNEIAPRDFLFRVREFDLMEFEYFVKESQWEENFEKWRKEMWAWVEKVGIDKNKTHELEVPKEDRAHYSKRTIDFEFEYPFGKKELYGLAYRGDYDLTRHMEHSGVDTRYADSVSGEKFIPHVIEPTFGLGRTMLAVLLSAYSEDELGGEKRILLKLNPKIAPVTAAVFPLVKNKPDLVAKAREIYTALKKEIPNTAFDDNGNIGKRYRRQDEIGTPWCVTIDYQTLEDDTVTIRARDTGKQERHKISKLDEYFKEMLK
ncbi:MAG: glycine--tRNA ligase [Candidatus Giovannonibacteria bacterium]|nr:glycine--tRNA ligase [Candidatus Giovannonibacteria bacterium]